MSEKTKASATYERPKVRDYGDLRELTQAQGFTGAEDGGSKALIHHEPDLGISLGILP